MPSLKLAVQLRSLKLPLKRALPIVNQWRVPAVELDARGEISASELSQTGRRQLRKLLDDFDLRVAAVGFRTRRGYDVTDELERRVEATKAAMTLAHDLGASLLINQVGRVPAEPEGSAWQTMLDALGDLGRHGQRVGVLLAAETGSEAGADLARLLTALPTGTMAVALNPGNLIINGFSPAEAIATVGQHVAYVRAKDGVRDLAQGRGIEVPLGRGVADFPALLGAIEEYDYRGYWTIERERADDPVAETADAISYLRSL
jgi:sugar phosphate isomerase/epimerase